MLDIDHIEFTAQRAQMMSTAVVLDLIERIRELEQELADALDISRCACD